MLLANKAAITTVPVTLKVVALNPLQNTNPIAVYRRKLVLKVDHQIQFAANRGYKHSQRKWVTDEHCNQRPIEIAERFKR